MSIKYYEFAPFVLITFRAKFIVTSNFYPVDSNKYYVHIIYVMYICLNCLACKSKVICVILFAITAIF